MEFKVKGNENKLILVLILIIGIVLRLYRFNEIPFTHDEFSALFRTQFSSFSELIEKGIKIDGHPAGVQVFLFYWVKVTGFNEFWVKFPFILFGVASIYLMYLFAERWFNSSVALFCSAIVATSEYTLMYSQIARPYASGLFFALMLIYFFQIIIEKEKPSLRSYLGFIVFSALCAYNHHFSLLLSGVLGLTGIVLVNGKERMKFVGTNLLVAILYLPHLSIFLYQLNKGGVGGWLSAPSNDFLWQYINYIFHFSNYVWFALFAIMVYAIYQWKNIVIRIPYFVSVILFLIPFLIAFFYSKWRNPVIQYSTLIFFFPFLLMFLFGWIPKFTWKVNAALCLLLLSANVYSLIEERKYYHLFYTSGYEHIVKESFDAIENDSKETLVFLDSPPDFTEYYLNKWQRSLDYEIPDSIPPSELITILKSSSADYVSYGFHAGASPHNLNLMMDYYPVLLRKEVYFGCSYYLLAKEGNTRISECKTVYERKDSTSFDFSEGQEFGNSINVLYDSIIFNENNFLDVCATIRNNDSRKQISLVTEVGKRGKSISWHGADAVTFFQESDSLQKIFLSVKLSDALEDLSCSEFKIYLWNSDKKAIQTLELKVKVREGNPHVYGLFEKF